MLARFVAPRSIARNLPRRRSRRADLRERTTQWPWLKGYHQPTKGELYVRGLLTDGQRKSMQPMAERLGVDHQQLQQFITSSSWDYEAVRRNVATWAAGAIDPRAYVVDDSGFPKDGKASPCVARQ